MDSQLRLRTATVAQAEAAARMMPAPPGEGDGCTCPSHQPLGYQDCYIVTEGCPLHDLDIPESSL